MECPKIVAVSAAYSSQQLSVLSLGAKSSRLPIWVRSTFLFPPRLQFVNFFRHSICFSVFDIMLVTKIRWFLENLFSNFYCNFQTVCSSISNVAAKRQSLLVCGQIIWVRKKLLARQAERVICKVLKCQIFELQLNLLVFGQTSCAHNL